MSYQAKPVRAFVMTSDALSQKLFGGVFLVKANQQRAGIKILDACRKGRKICSLLDVKNPAPVDFVLTEFDRAVHDAVVSELAAGNKFFTFNMLYRDLGGNTKDPVPAAMKKAITESLAKLKFLILDLDMSDAAENSSYKITQKKLAGGLIDVVFGKTSLNGKPVEAYQIRGALLNTVANSKNQIIRLAVDTLDLKLRLTPRVIAIVHYIIRRVAQITGSHKSASLGKKNLRLSTSITFANLNKCCGFRGLKRWQRQDIREITAQILNAFVEKKLLQSWQFSVSPTGEFRAIKLELAPLVFDKFVK